MRTARPAPALALGALALAGLALTACGDGAATARYAARQAAADPPQLWLAQALDSKGQAVDSVFLCADTGLKQGLARASAWVNRQPCLPHRDAVDRPDFYTVRCEAAGRVFGLTLNRSGDLERDFTVRTSLKALDGTGQGAGHVRRYRRVGACPAGWAIGDQAKPGRTPASSAVGLVGRHVDLSHERS